MKRAVHLLVIFAVYLTSSSAPAASSIEEVVEDRPTGIGAILGVPTSITLQFWQGTRESADLGLAFSYGNYWMVYGDYLFHFPEAFGNEVVTPYVGPGAFVTSAPGFANFALGVRVPVGLEWFPRGTPVGVFLEAAPSFSVVPAIYAFFSGGVGVRFFF